MTDEIFSRLGSSPETSAGDTRVWHRRRRYLKICLAATLLIGFASGLADIWRGFSWESVGKLGMAAVSLGLYWKLPSLRRPGPLFHLYGIGMGAFLLVELAIGGADGHAFLWILLLPPIYFSLFGSTVGLRYSMLLLLLTGGVFFWALPAESVWLVRCVSVLLVVTGLGFLLEFSREHMLSRLEAESRRLVQALEHADTLRGLIPLCPGCHKVKDDAGFWTRVEHYLSERTGARLSHGLCPACGEKAMAELLSVERTT